MVTKLIKNKGITLGPTVGTDHEENISKNVVENTCRSTRRAKQKAISKIEKMVKIFINRQLYFLDTLFKKGGV